MDDAIGGCSDICLDFWDDTIGGCSYLCLVDSATCYNADYSSPTLSQYIAAPSH